ncbi:MAG TPA: ABC transporter permease [Nitrospirales bacterium]|nr:ABC transporter permease [Nitrospirales bacterium]HIA13823.1 ABC transporter permease [Nitrospirales bacterium]HIB54001.1 ABC transporter permease [Nitrospirales bacterium]HIC04611.1 ABC transporter permease [Nitrospirales bacterium]HIN33791.1 ABC transporter permease [Nitrospirales bacterium]
MWTYIARNILQRIVTLIIVSIVAHSFVHLAPGEPSEVDPSNPRMKPADIELIRAAFHLDDPLYLQYGYWMRDLFTGELKSFKDNQPVLPKIWQRFLNSLPLLICATLIIWSLSFPTGIYAAIRRGSVYDRTTTFTAYALISIPGFFLSYIMILWVVNTFNVPVIGMKTFGMEDADLAFRSMDRLWHLVLPSALSAVGGIAVLSRYVRSQMLEVIGQDYVRTARAKGLSEDNVIYRHALQNALLPFVTMFGFLLPALIGGSVIFEQIFAWPGLGRLGYEAILARDFPVILTINLIAAVLTLAGTLVSDLLYAVVDPRIRLQ